MEIIRKAPGKVYYKSNTSVAIKLLAFLAVVLVLLVLGVCIFVIFGIGNTKNYFLDASQTFYYSVNSDAKTARLAMFIDQNATDFTVPDSVNHKGDTYRLTEIGAEAFTNNKKLAKVTVGNNVELIAGNATKKTGAFSGCVNLQTVKLGENVRNIGNYAFKNCLALPTIDLPATVQFVGSGAFMFNLALTEIKLNGGNTRLDTASFAYCEQVKTLALGNEVILDNDKKQALAELPNLTTFTLAADNPRYVYGGAEHDCLLNQVGDTLVISGQRDTLPDTVTKIDDWAFGNRYGSNDIFLPQAVTDVAENAFSTGIIYTDATVKPANWQTNLPVRCGAKAKKVTFHRNYNTDDTVTADAYTFTTDPNDEAHYVLIGDKYYPRFSLLFGATDKDHVLTKEQWTVIDNDTCNAEFENGETATADDLSALNAVIAQADEYISCTTEAKENNRLKFTVTFWEEFKSAFGMAKNIVGKGSDAYAYEVKNATVALQNCLTKLQNPDQYPPIKVDIKAWRDNLRELLAIVETASNNRNDFLANPDAWKNIDASSKEAVNYLANENCTDEEGISMCRVLRSHYEKLQANLDANTPLNQLIAEFSALNADDYTTESWEKLQDVLATARSITQYNTSVSQVRLALAQARENLVENNLATHEQLVELSAWVSICGDLPESDYLTTNYDRLRIAWNGAYAVLQKTDATASEVDDALSTLRSNYNSLVAIDKEPVESGNNVVARNLVSYFVIALVLFTIAIIIQAVASAMKKNQRSKKHE